MKMRHVLVAGIGLFLAACVATAAWSPACAAQPEDPTKPKTVVKHKKPAARSAPGNATKPQGEVSRPEVQRGY